MKDFSKFLEEITIKGNTGIPGEEDKNEPNYLRGIEGKGQDKIRGIRDPRPLFMEIMNLMQRGKAMVRGKETELEQFAEEMIRSVYSGILDNVDLDIKLVRDGNAVAKFMEDEECEDCDDGEKVQRSSSKELKLEVDKRKLANNIIQGEAKNTKLVIEMPECKDGLKRILGDTRGEEYHRLVIEISKIADKLDWIIPVEAKAEMMEAAPEGMAGACSVKWPEAKEEKPQKTAEEILKSLEEGGDLDDNKEEIEEMLSTGKPVIKARGIDFPMLLHETVKGIYELIAAAGIPEDEKMAKNVMFNTSSFADEAEDFKYGPYIAADLRDFVNKSPNIDKYPNIREFVFGKLISMPAEEFLKNIKNILLNAPEARTLVNKLVDDVIKNLDEYEKSSSDFDAKQTLGELDEPVSEEPKETREEPREDAEMTKIANQEVDYSKWRQADIQAEVDTALDNGDYERVKMLSQYLKEGKEIYLREIERINESHKFHDRRRNNIIN